MLVIELFINPQWIFLILGNGSVANSLRLKSIKLSRLSFTFDPGKGMVPKRFYSNSIIGFTSFGCKCKQMYFVCVCVQ